MKLVYFAWVRERIGKGSETIDKPGSVVTVADLLAWLAERGEGYAAALAHPEVIRVAIDHEHVEHDTPLPEDGEIALFPPMTGG
jgi:molybdopterin synthase sulfur carrier subunit